MKLVSKHVVLFKVIHKHSRQTLVNKTISQWPIFYLNGALRNLPVLVTFVPLVN
jgi:hypothetical protein